MIDYTANPIYPSVCEFVDGSHAVNAGTNLVTVGYSVNTLHGLHGFLRFNTGAVLNPNVTPCNTELTLTVEADSTPTIGIDLWSSEFGTTVGSPDYDQAANNNEAGTLGATGLLRARIYQLTIPGSVKTGTVISLPIPSRFIRLNAALQNQGFSDFEMRPALVNGVYPSMSAGDIVTFYGSAAVTVANRPQLTGYALTDAELQAPNNFRFQAIGAESYVALGIEATRGVAVQGRYMLDITGSNLDTYANQITSAALSSKRVHPRKMGVGSAGAGGSIDFETTPEKWTRVFLGFAKLTRQILPPAVPTVAAAAGAGNLGGTPVTTTVTTGATSATQQVGSTAAMTVGMKLWFVTAALFRTVVSITDGTHVVLNSSLTTTNGETVQLALGAYTYLVVFVQDVNNSALDSSPGTASTAVIVDGAHAQVNLTNIPVDTGKNGVVARKIYRTKVGGTTYFLLTTINDNTTTTYTDNIADSALGTFIPSYGQAFNRLYMGLAQSNEVATFTVVEKKGFLRYVYPGAMANSLQLTTRPDRVVTGRLDVEARAQWPYDEDAAGGPTDLYLLEGGAAYDSVANGDLSYIGSQVTLDGITTGDLVQDFELTFAQQVSARRGMDRRRNPSSHYALGLMISFRFSMYFDNEVVLRKALGDISKKFPTDVSNNIVFQQIVLSLAGDKDGDPRFGEPACQQINITLPSAAYQTVRSPVNNEDAIFLDCTGVSVWNDTTQANFAIELLTAEAPSDFAVSANPITVLPKGAYN